MYDATGVRLHAGRQAEVWCFFFSWFPFNSLQHFSSFSWVCQSIFCPRIDFIEPLLFGWDVFYKYSSNNIASLWFFFSFGWYHYMYSHWILSRFWIKLCMNFLLSILWQRADHCVNFLATHPLRSSIYCIDLCLSLINGSWLCIHDN